MGTLGCLKDVASGCASVMAPSSTCPLRWGLVEPQLLQESDCGPGWALHKSAADWQLLEAHFGWKVCERGLWVTFASVRVMRIFLGRSKEVSSRSSAVLETANMMRMKLLHMTAIAPALPSVVLGVVSQILCAAPSQPVSQTSSWRHYVLHATVCSISFSTVHQSSLVP